MPKAAIKTLVQDLFAYSRDGDPKLLLVHDEKTTLDVLHSLGVNTSTWKSGIKSLLYRPDSVYDDTSKYRSSPVRDMHDRKSKESRRRSRSPRRRDYASSMRPRSPPPLPAPVYMVDVQDMHCALTRQYKSQASVLSDAKALAVQNTALERNEKDEVVYEGIDPKYWCAGKESR